MDAGRGFFDGTIDAHGELMSVPEPDRCRYLRAYMNARLLFFPRVYLTDATINNSPAFRQLVIPRKRSRLLRQSHDLPCDYAELVEKGVIAAVVRDDVPPETFSSALRGRQKKNANSDIPSPNYCSAIEELFSSPDASVTQFHLDDVARLFTRKVGEVLKRDLRNREANRIRATLANDVASVSTVTLNELLTLIGELGHKQGSPIYEQFKHLFGLCYTDNVPQSLMLSYQTIVGSRHSRSLDIPVTEHRVPQRYVLDVDCLAYLPSSELTKAMELDERDTFVSALRLFHSQPASGTDDLIGALEAYVRTLNEFFRDYYTAKALSYVGARRERPLYIRVLGHWAYTAVEITVGAITPPPVPQVVAAEAFARLCILQCYERPKGDTGLLQDLAPDLARRSAIVASGPPHDSAMQG
jgi:hypothetical protein